MPTQARRHADTTAHPITQDIARCLLGGRALPRVGFETVLRRRSTDNAELRVQNAGDGFALVSDAVPMREWEQAFGITVPTGLRLVSSR